MKEDFIHFVWLNKLFNSHQLKTICNKGIVVHHVGDYLQTSGPDFFNASITIDNQKWAGNVEIHVNSSDWYIHQHQNDKSYDNVILHVVWNHDVDVYQKGNSIIPVLELKSFVNSQVLENYHNLMTQKKWIFCENYISKVPEINLNKWLETLFFERLEQKSSHIQSYLNQSKNHWEYALFIALAKNFGLNANGLVFEDMAKIITFDTLSKEVHNLEHIEALFFGVCGLLDKDFEDNYPKKLKELYTYLKSKYSHLTQTTHKPEFFKLRPDNFPTIRMAQLAQIYHQNHFLFDKIIDAIKNNKQLQFLNVNVSNYWLEHYNFDKSSKKKNKTISKQFLDLIIINTITPMYYIYNQQLDNQNIEWLEFLEKTAPEANVIIERFEQNNIKVSNVMQSQALIHLKKNYCDHKKCMSCQVGKYLIKA